MNITVELFTVTPPQAGPGVPDVMISDEPPPADLNLQDRFLDDVVGWDER